MRRIVWISVVFVAAGCRRDPGDHAHAAGHGTHAAASGVTSLDVYADRGAVHLLIGTERDGRVRLNYLRSDDEGRTWSEPVRVDEGGPRPHGPVRGNDAQIAASGENLLAVWTTAGTGFMGSGPLATAVSRDGGRTWAPAQNPADDGSTAGHGFVDAVADEDGSFHLVWLDGRSGRQGLIYARSDDGGKTWGRNRVLDPETCECCWSTLLADSGRINVLYRDKSPRDMKIVSSTDRGRTWSAPEPVDGFQWEFDGCPHVGGGLSVDADGRLHATAWTAREGVRGLHHYIGTPGEPRWRPLETNWSDAARHSDLASAGRSLARVWDAQGAVFVAISRDSGESWSEPRRLSAKEASATHPRVVSAGKTLLVFWTELGGNGSATWRFAPIGGGP
jgi:hypothetical protein